MWIWLIPIGIAAALIILREVVASSIFRLYTQPPRFNNKETPADFGLAFDELSFTSDGIKHAAWLIHPPDSSPDTPLPTVLMPHGFAANRADILPRIAAVAKAGMRVFTFDWRGHGDSGKGQCSGGLVEREDLSAALAFMRTLEGVEPGRIAMYGFSMGAAITILVAAEEEEIRCVVADSPYYGLAEIMESILGKLLVPRALVRGALRKRFMKTFGKEYSAIDMPAAVKNIPPERMLLLGGTADKLVPFEHVKRLHEEIDGKAQLYINEGGGHFDNADPAILSGVVIPFLKQHLGLNESA